MLMLTTMKYHSILLFLTLGLLGCGLLACGKQAATNKTAAQQKADEKAIAVWAAADKIIADQNASEALRTAEIKEKAAKEVTKQP